MLFHVYWFQIYGMFYYGIIDHNFSECYREMSKLVPTLDINDFIQENSVYDLKDTQPAVERQQFLESDEFDRPVGVQESSDDEDGESPDDVDDNAGADGEIGEDIGAGFDEEDAPPPSPRTEPRQLLLAHSELNMSARARGSCPLPESRFRSQSSRLGRRLVKKFTLDQDINAGLVGSSSRRSTEGEEEDSRDIDDDDVPEPMEDTVVLKVSAKTSDGVPIVPLSDSEDDDEDEPPLSANTQGESSSPVIPVVAVRLETVPQGEDEVFNAAGKAPHPGEPVVKRDIDWFDWNQARKKKKQEKNERDAEATRILVEEARLAKERAETQLREQQEREKQRDREIADMKAMLALMVARNSGSVSAPSLAPSPSIDQTVLAHSEQTGLDVPGSVSADTAMPENPPPLQLPVITPVLAETASEEDLQQPIPKTTCKSDTPVPQTPDEDDDIDGGVSGDRTSMEVVKNFSNVSEQGQGNSVNNQSSKEGPSDCHLDTNLPTDGEEDELVDYENSPEISLSLPDALPTVLESQKGADGLEVCGSGIYINLKL